MAIYATFKITAIFRDWDPIECDESVPPGPMWDVSTKDLGGGDVSGAAWGDTLEEAIGSLVAQMRLRGTMLDKSLGFDETKDQGKNV